MSSLGEIRRHINSNCILLLGGSTFAAELCIVDARANRYLGQEQLYITCYATTATDNGALHYITIHYII